MANQRSTSVRCARLARRRFTLPTVITVAALMAAAAGATADSPADARAAKTPPTATAATSSDQLLRGRVTIPVVSDRSDRQPFAGHPGWLDAYGPGGGQGVSVRIGDDAGFAIESAPRPRCVIVTFDAIETPPLIVPRWPIAPGSNDLPMIVEYACVPAGYPAVWDSKYRVRSHEFWQTFVARSRHLYGLMAFDGPRIAWWGNKINVAVYRDGVGGPRIDFAVPWGTGPNDNPSAHHTDHAYPRVGWRHGDIDLTPGLKYAVRVCGYKSHGGALFDLDTFIYPDTGDGYGPGQAYVRNVPSGGDLCMMLFGSLNGQLVENHVRSEEWNVFIVKRPPTKRWGQSFTAHGVSLAGLRFWGSDGLHGAAADKDGPLTCTIRIREDGPAGKLVGPPCIARAHDTSTQVAVGPSNDPAAQGHEFITAGAPVVRYPETPGPLPGYEAYYKLPFDLFQAAWLPDEVALKPGKTYYVEIEASRPLMMFADGDAYAGGFGYYDGQKVEKEPHLMHDDPRWTLLMDIVTYENPGGAPETAPAIASGPRKPGPDGNLLLNGGAENGTFANWTVGSDPTIDPSTDIPSPANHSGRHRFGISVGWAVADMYQYQEVPGVTAGQPYVASMWACHRDGTDESAELAWCDGPFGGPEHLIARTEPDANPTWTRYAGAPFVPTKNTVTIVVRYRHTKPSNIASIHVDDIDLRPAPFAAAQTVEKK